MENEEKLGLKETIAYEKEQMLPLNYFVSYKLTPIYVLVSLLLMVVFAVLMEIDEEKYFVYGMLCLGAFVLISIAILAMVPYVRKKAIETELVLYDFDTSTQEELEIYDFSTQEHSLKFDAYGLYLDGELYYYESMKKHIATGNYCNRVRLSVDFELSKQIGISFPVNPKTLKMLQSLQIKLDNQPVLDYILANKKDAFTQIYKFGRVANLHSKG